MANFTVYLDDSGTASEHPIAIAGAFIIPAKQIIPLETAWGRFTKRLTYAEVTGKVGTTDCLPN